MKSLSRCMLQIAFVLCVGDVLHADESQYLLAPQYNVGGGTIATHQGETQALASELSPEVKVTSEGSLPRFGPRDSQKHPLRTVVSSLAIVLGAFLLAAAILRRQGNASRLSATNSGSIPADLMHNMGELQVTPAVKLNLVRVGSRLLVLHLSDDGVQTVAEINADSDEQQSPRHSSGTKDASWNPSSWETTEQHHAAKPSTPFGSHPQVGDLLRRVEEQVKELA